AGDDFGAGGGCCARAASPAPTSTPNTRTACRILITAPPSRGRKNAASHPIRIPVFLKVTAPHRRVKVHARTTLALRPCRAVGSPSWKRHHIGSLNVAGTGARYGR